MDTTLDWLDSSYDRMLGELTALLSIPSVSTDSASKADVDKCARWLENHLKQIGMPVVEFHETAGHPIIYAEHLGAGPSAPTVLFYGHYDVQPVDPIELWTTPPFEPQVRDGKIFARGATDDKGQAFVHVKAVEALLATTQSLPVNIKMLIEGEEEISSPNLTPFVIANTEKLKADVVVVSDTSMYAPGQPSLITGLRGLAYTQINVVGPNRDLHSGSYGGPVVNPLNALCTIVAGLRDAHGRITIPGFYDNVPEIDPREKASILELGHSPTDLMNDLNVDSLGGESGYLPIELMQTRPTLDVNGIHGGFTGEGAKTVLPSRAFAKVSMRLVPHQDQHDIFKKFCDHVMALAPDGVRVTIDDLHGANPVLVSMDTSGVRAASRALEETYGKKCLYHREGGSIPVVELFDRVLKAPTVLMGFGLKTENLHSPNEHFYLDNFKAGMKAAVRFYRYLAEV